MFNDDQIIKNLETLQNSKKEITIAADDNNL